MVDIILKQIVKRKIIIKYLLAGSTAAFVDLALLYFFVKVIHFHYLVSATLAFAVAIFVSFYLQKFWTFRDDSREDLYKQLSQYVAVGLFNLGVNAGLMYLLVDKLFVWFMLAQVISAGTIALESFILYKFFIFNQVKEKIL